MANERWSSPFHCTLSFNLFKKHFTELNRIYWAFIPAASTIVSHAKIALVSDDADIKNYFLFHDEDEKTIAKTYGEWKNYFNEFSNYTRLNMIMLLSSCFETYLRTIVSNAFESKPGVIIMSPDSVDGIFLLKSRVNYGDISDKNYQFTNEVDEICKGDWTKRFAVFEKYFGALPKSITDMTAELDKLRVMRNNIGHYIGRAKENISAQIYLSPVSATRVSHNRVLKAFGIYFNVAKELDGYLKTKYIGSYDIIKLYLQLVSAGTLVSIGLGERARELQKYLGKEGLALAGNEYYRNIVGYCDLDNQNELCIYSRIACIKEINRQLDKKGIALIRDGHSIRFKNYHFNLFIKAHGWRENPEYSKKYRANQKQNEYRYSYRVISEIVKRITAEPENIAECLASQIASRLKDDNKMVE